MRVQAACEAVAAALASPSVPLAGSSIATGGSGVAPAPADAITYGKLPVALVGKVQVAPTSDTAAADLAVAATVAEPLSSEEAVRIELQAAHTRAHRDVLSRRFNRRS